MNRHDTDAVSLAFGLVFLGAAGWWLLSRLVDLTAAEVGWFVGVTLIAAGVLGVLVTVRPVHRHPS